MSDDDMNIDEGEWSNHTAGSPSHLFARSCRGRRRQTQRERIPKCWYVTFVLRSFSG